MLSATKELEPGARAMLIYADGLFRFDIAISGDTLRTVVRNLSPAAIEMRRGAGGQGLGHVAFGEAAEYEPGSSGVGFVLGEGADQVTVEVQIATLRMAQRGTVRVSAQAIVRQAASS